MRLASTSTNAGFRCHASTVRHGHVAGGLRSSARSIAAHQRRRVLRRQDRRRPVDALDVETRSVDRGGDARLARSACPRPRGSRSPRRASRPAACCWVISISGDMPMTRVAAAKLGEQVLARLAPAANAGDVGARRRPGRAATRTSSGRRRCGSWRGGLGVNEVDEPPQHVRVGLGQHAVAEVEDVARAVRRPGRARRACRLRRPPSRPRAAPGRGCPGCRGRSRCAARRRRAARASRRSPGRCPPRPSASSSAALPVPK